MQTSTKICKCQVTTTFKMSIGYLQIFRVTSNESRHKMFKFLFADFCKWLIIRRLLYLLKYSNKVL